MNKRLSLEPYKLDTHARRVMQSLAFVPSGGTSSPELMQQLELNVIEDRQDDSDVPDSISETDLLALEPKAFMALIKSKETEEKNQGGVMIKPNYKKQDDIGMGLMAAVMLLATIY